MIPDQTKLIYASFTVAVILVGLIIILSLREVRQRNMDARVALAIGAGGTGGINQSGSLLIDLLRNLGARFRRFYSPDNIETLQMVIQSAGHNPNTTLPILLGSKMLLMIVLPILTFFVAIFFDSSFARISIVGSGVIAGMLGPDWVLGFMRRRFVDSLEHSTPDAIDLLVICSEAGMGLESGLQRVSQDMVVSSPEVSMMLSGLLGDLRILSQQEAFVNLGTRSGAAGLRRVGIMLNQSMSYGTPLSHALRAVAQELRTDRMNKLEEKAVKLPAKLIFPMLVFIMPTLYVVLLGPSLMRLFDILSTAITTTGHGGI